MTQKIQKKFLSDEVINYFDNQIDAAEQSVLTEKGRSEGQEAAIREELAAADAAKLAEAKQFAQDQDALKLAEAKEYAQDQDALKLLEAKQFAQDQDALKLVEAKQFSQDQDALKLSEAKEYAELKVAEAKSEIMGGILSSTLDTIKEIADALESEQTATGAILTQLSGLESSKASKVELAAGVAEAKAYSDSQIAAIPSVDISGKADKSYVDSQDAALQSDLDNLDGYAQDIRSDLDNLDGYAQDIRSDLDAEVIAIDLRLDVLEAKVDGPAFSNEKIIVGAELGFLELSMQVKKIMSCAVGRLAVHEGEDFDVTVVGGKSRIVWKGSLLSPSGEECIETGMNVFVVYAY
jgi:hypothetical protein